MTARGLLGDGYASGAGRHVRKREGIEVAAHVASHL